LNGGLWIASDQPRPRWQWSSPMAARSAAGTIRPKHELCFRCLETGHMAKGCREGRPCGVDGCRQRHH
ncbi:hypothetical protein T05_12538, partial [Trichinella murrelli]